MKDLDALALALYLAVSAPDDDKLDAAMKHALALAGGMEPDEVSAAVALVSKKLAEDADAAILKKVKEVY